jgi:dienelactone hydrolase
MPDVFNKDPVPLNPPEGFDFMNGWFPKHGPETVKPVVEDSLKQMREKYGCKNIGGVGYCFGAKYVIQYLKKGQIDAGYVAHPSFVTEDELSAIENPLSIAAAETDEIYPAEKRHASEAILAKKDVPYQQNLFSDVVHGFAVRADISKKQARFAKEQAFLQAVHWFDEYLKA